MLDKCRYVRCIDPRLTSFDQHEKSAADLGWPIHRIAAGHDAMVSHPDDVLDAVLG